MASVHFNQLEGEEFPDNFCCTYTLPYIFTSFGGFHHALPVNGDVFNRKRVMCVKVSRNFGNSRLLPSLLRDRDCDWVRPLVYEPREPVSQDIVVHRTDARMIEFIRKSIYHDVAHPLIGEVA